MPQPLYYFNFSKIAQATHNADGSLRVIYPGDATTETGLLPDNHDGGTYLSEIATVMRYGAPSFAYRNGVLTNLLTGQPVPETPPVELEREYADVGALLNDIAARNYLRQVIVDGTVLPYTQYGSLPPAGFGSDPVSGKLRAMDYLPSPTLPTVNAGETSPQPPSAGVPSATVIESRWPNPGETLRILVPGAMARAAYVLRLHAPAEASDALGRIVVAEMPGQPTVGRSIEIAVNGVVVVSRDTNLVSTIQENFRLGPGADADFIAPTGSVIEASMIGSGDGGFFWECRHK